MKKIILLLFVLLSFSCEKQELPEVSKPKVEELPITISYQGKWLLVDGKMYVSNLETNEKKVYNHFNINKTISSLRYYGSLFEFENLEVNKTTWTFISPNFIPGVGEFILNEDTLKKFGFNVTKNFCSIIEHPKSNLNNLQLGGSARPIRAFIRNHEDKSVYFYVQEAYISIDGYNCKTINELVFKKIEEW